MMKYTNEHKLAINSRFVIVKDEHTCLDCKHTFHDTHYFRKLSHLRNCEQQSEDTQKVITLVVSADPNAQVDSDNMGSQPAKKRRKGTPGPPEHMMVMNANQQQQQMQQQVQHVQQQMAPVQMQHVPMVHGPPVDYLTEQSAREITDALVTFFISASIPFGTVESNEFREFLEAIRPQYAAIVPSQADLERSYSGSN